MPERIVHLTRNDFVRQTFRAGGKGGQKQNKTSSGVRFIHPASGARGECREERSQEQNEQRAFRRMAESVKMRMWIAEQHQNWERGKTIEQEVEEMMTPDKILVEVMGEDGEWVRG